MRDPSRRGVTRTLWGVALATACAWSAGCITELPRRVACGDGFVDRDAGEQCDPADPDQVHVTQCAAQGFSPGAAGCDPMTCQVIVNNFQCSVCGDGKAEGNEACDVSVPAANAFCPDVERTTPACNLSICQADYSTCPTCQNGINEPNEECDPVDPCDGISPEGQNCEPGQEPPIVVPIDCSELEVLALNIDKSAYTQGNVTQADCTDSCQFGRQKCSFCGDGVLDPEHDDVGLGGAVFPRRAEECEEGLDVPTPLIQEKCNSWCRASSEDVPTLCRYQCIQQCRDVDLDIEFEGPIESADPVGDLGCCSPRGTPCDTNLEFPCCRALAEPGSGDGCVDQVLSTGELQSICG